MNTTSSPQNFSWASFTRFFRFEYLSVAIIFPLIGAATAKGTLTGYHVIGILLGAIAFHIYVSLLNDIVDLPLDRTNPARADYPLVSGKISLGFAIFLTFIQIPIAAAIIYWQGGGSWAFVAMAVGLGMMTIYNGWGKKTPFPLLIDLIQGVGFSALTIYGASLVGDLTLMSWIGFALGVIWMVQMNLLGGLRDLHSDLAFGVYTTPMQLGIRPAGKEETIPTFVHIYSHTLHALMLIGGLWIISLANYSSTLNIIMIVACLLINSFGFFLLATMYKAAEKKYEDMLAAGFRYIGISALGLFFTLLPALPGWVALLIIAAFFMRNREYGMKELMIYWQK